MAGPTLRLLAPILPLAAAAVLWRPIIDVYFHADDFTHLYDLATLDRFAFLTQFWVGHLLAVFNAVTLGLFTVFGPEPAPAFWVVFITHLINVLLIYWAVRRLGGDAIVAGCSAFVWGTCPTLAGALGWFSVYGQVLLTTIMLLLVGSLAGYVGTDRILSTGRALLWGIALIAGGACFGSGLGLAVVFPWVVMLALSRAQRPRHTLVILLIAGLLILAAYVLARQGSADFDPRGRELSSPVAALPMLPAVLAMTAQLVGFGAYALGVGALLPEVPVTGWLMGLAAAGAIALAATGWKAADPPMRRMQLALWLLVITVYATTAAGRVAVVDAMAVPVARAALWPRYQYLALAFLTLALASALGAIQARSVEARGVARGALGAWSALRLLLLALHPVPIDLHADARAKTATALAAMRRAIAATPPGTVARIDNQPFGALTLPQLFPGWAGLFVIHFPDDVVDGRPVRFVVSEEDWVRIQARGGRIASLVERR